MVTYDALNSHFEYADVVRHYSPQSEKYAGGDALVTLLHQGWEIEETVLYEEYWHSGTRPVIIYHVELIRGSETLKVPVLTNPYIRRIIDALPVQIRALEDQPRRSSTRKQ